MQRFFLNIFVTFSVAVFLPACFFDRSLQALQGDLSDLKNPIQKENGEVSVTLSHAGGFYPKPFQLEMESNQADLQIYYTLDGSEPSLANLKKSEEAPESQAFTLRYEVPISILARKVHEYPLSHFRTSRRQARKPRGRPFTGTVVRFQAFRGDEPVSGVHTQSYFIHPSGAARYSLPVISISTDRANLFGEKNGIYAHVIRERSSGRRPHYEMRGRKWERPAHIEFFEPNGELGFAQNIGIRIHGGHSRTYPQKNLRLYARASYDESSWFDYPIFPDLKARGTGEPLTRFKRLLLRTSGQDHLHTKFRDGLMHELAQDFTFDTQAYRPSVVFINGEYWGIHNIRERQDQHYLSTHYGIEKKESVILKRGGLLDEGEKGEDAHYRKIISFIRSKSLSDERSFQTVAEWIDLSNYMDYYATEIYFGNSNWPENNIRFWRFTGPKKRHMVSQRDGRWRWMLFDADFGFGLHRNRWIAAEHGQSSRASINMISAVMQEIHSVNKRPWPNELFRALMQNDGFRSEFLQRLSHLLQTQFETSRVEPVIDRLADVIRPEWSEHARRWRLRSLSSWESEVHHLRYFSKRRAPFVRMNVRDYFEDVDGVFRLEMSATRGGSLELFNQAIPLSEDGVFLGEYFSGIPLKLEAKASDGFEFVEWESSHGAPMRSSLLQMIGESGAEISVRAVFRPL
jgi:hypothetical protein